MRAILFCLLLASHGRTTAEDYFQIQIVDEATGRGVPLVEVTTVHGIRMWTDSAGIVAFHEPGLMDRDVFFSIKSHGYEFARTDSVSEASDSRQCRGAALF
jgi:hypothetical protein